jgi:hypothetical protein
MTNSSISGRLIDDHSRIDRSPFVFVSTVYGIDASDSRRTHHAFADLAEFRSMSFQSIVLLFQFLSENDINLHVVSGARGWVTVVDGAGIGAHSARCNRA